MLNIENYYCPNERCNQYGLKGQGNIVKSGRYGKKGKQLLQCNVCKQRFSETNGTVFFNSNYSGDTIQKIISCVAEGNGVRATARILGLDKNAVNRIIIKAGKHCTLMLSNMIHSLQLKECQVDELWTFVQKKTFIARRPVKRIR